MIEIRFGVQLSPKKNKFLRPMYQKTIEINNYQKISKTATKKLKLKNMMMNLNDYLNPLIKTCIIIFLNSK